MTEMTQPQFFDADARARPTFHYGSSVISVIQSYPAQAISLFNVI